MRTAHAAVALAVLLTSSPSLSGGAKAAAASDKPASDKAVSGKAVSGKGAASPLPAPEARCRVTDERLDELSGMAAGDGSWYTVADGGTELRVYELDPQDCSVRDVLRASIDPYDVEGLARKADGTLFLADTGDNRAQRDTVAVHVIEPGGGASLYRLRYPDGPRDAEALLLGRDGSVLIITKNPFGPAGIYRPASALDPDRPVALERVGELDLPESKTPGGPLPSGMNSTAVTGAARGPAGRVVAVRTYTDAYLYQVSNGAVLAGLTSDPLRVPLPNEPQGEAIAFDGQGTLLSASEGAEPVRAVPGAVRVALARTRGAATSKRAPRPVRSAEEKRGDRAEHQEKAGESAMGAVIIAGVLAALGMAVWGRLRRR